jgi:hypothetical protein
VQNGKYILSYLLNDIEQSIICLKNQETEFDLSYEDIQNLKFYASEFEKGLPNLIVHNNSVELINLEKEEYLQAHPELRK